MEKINIREKFGLFTERWSPKIIGEVNDCEVKIARLCGEFEWHSHEREDEMFLVVKGRLLMKFRDREVRLDEGELLIVPRGVEHLPVAAEEAWVLFFEPKGTVNTGNVPSDRTVVPERI